MGRMAKLYLLLYAISAITVAFWSMAGLYEDENIASVEYFIHAS